MTYKGCKITKYHDGYVWEELHYGAESDDVFATVDDAKADIDRLFGNDPAPREINNELYA